ncbi:MAG TPA: M23 family metallopeptidase [Thermoanaerobaculia bacterium]|nr:M23 family metallopeptidase [Thermoanaerobaculia bacterium]
MRKSSVLPAAVLAAGFALLVCPAAEAGTHKKKSAPSVATVSKTASKTSASKVKAVSASSHTRAKSTRKTRRAAPAAPETVAEVYGPFLPAELYDYPQPECREFDAVVEAHEHEIEKDGPDDDVAEAVPPPVNPLTRVARTLGSLLRPKSAESTLRPEDVDLTDLLTAGVQIPVEGVDASRLKDSFLNSRGKHRQHLAIDIGAPKGTPVLAAADGEVVSLRHEKRGGISLYQKDATGRYLLFYCHLTRYAQGLKAGRKVAKGDVIAYVGRTGHVIGGPHLHFSITRLPEDDDNFKAGVAINPYLLFLAAVP